MITKLSKWILYLSSYIPLYIIFIVSNCFDIYNNHKLLIQNTECNLNNLISLVNSLYSISKINFILILLFSVISLFSLGLLLKIINQAGKCSEYIDIYSIKKNNKSINEYILVYILPFITVKTNDYKELATFIIVFLLIGVITVKNDLVYINPILYFLKYNIYLFKENNDSSEESIIISRHTILQLKKLRDTSNSLNKMNTKASKIADGVFYIK